jgi:type IV pilus assembly protein PilB
VVAQRLARQLCTYCKRRTVIPAQALQESGFRVGADLEAYEAVGCARCGHSGYRGRIGLFSVMLMSEEIKSLTVRRAPEAEIAEVARAQGMISVREDGLQKARSGVTSIEEVARVST